MEDTYIEQKSSKNPSHDSLISIFLFSAGKRTITSGLKN